MPESTRPTATAYRTLVRARLAELRPALVKELSERVFVQAFPEGTRSLDYEIFCRGLSRALPIVGYLMDGERGQVMIRKRGGAVVLAPNITVLSPVDPVLPPRTVQPFVDAGIEVGAITQSLLRSWFVEAWSAAGGKQRFPLPASIAYHDGDRPTRLPSATKRDASHAGTPRAGPKRRRLTCTANGANTFWEGAVKGCQLVVQTGRIGNMGRKKTKAFASEAEATAALEVELKERRREGYVER